LRSSRDLDRGLKFGAAIVTRPEVVGHQQRAAAIRAIRPLPSIFVRMNGLRPRETRGLDNHLGSSS
jgi:hypothetical protein